MHKHIQENKSPMGLNASRIDTNKINALCRLDVEKFVGNARLLNIFEHFKQFLTNWDRTKYVEKHSTYKIAHELLY